MFKINTSDHAFDVNSKIFIFKIIAEGKGITPQTRETIYQIFLHSLHQTTMKNQAYFIE
jgi:hypothetical protein